jgi:hypothetical protein
MMVSVFSASRVRLTLATVPADRGAELEAAIEALGLIALKTNVVRTMRSIATTAQWPQSTPKVAPGAWRLRVIKSHSCRMRGADFRYGTTNFGKLSWTR